jgi:hypothetical protein
MPVNSYPKLKENFSHHVFERNATLNEQVAHINHHFCTSTEIVFQIRIKISHFRQIFQHPAVENAIHFFAGTRGYIAGAHFFFKIFTEVKAHWPGDCPAEAIYFLKDRKKTYLQMGQCPYRWQPKPPAPPHCKEIRRKAQKRKWYPQAAKRAISGVSFPSGFTV